MNATPEQATVTIPWPVPDELKRRATSAAWEATGRNVNRATACDAWKAALGVLIESLPAPALTDEQIDGGFDGDGIRLMYESLIQIWAERYGETRAVSDWYAAVIARAKREEREQLSLRFAEARDSCQRAANDETQSKASRARFALRAESWDDAYMEVGR